MRLRRFATMASCAMLALTAAACSDANSGDGASAEEDVAAEGSIESMEAVTFKFNESAAPTSGSAEAARIWMEEVTEKTDGKIKFEEYFASALLASTETLEGVGSGVADISQVTTQAFPEALPISAWLAQAASYLDAGFPATGIQGIMAGAQFTLDSPELRQEYADNNMVALRSGTSNFGNAICKEPIETLEDAKGVRIRVAGEPAASEAKAIGMEPVVVPGTEMFEALQRGVVDCVTASDGGEVYSAIGLTDIAKYYVPIRFSPTTFIGIHINKDQWESLPADAQQIMRDAWATYEVERLRATMEGFTRFMDTADEQKVEFTDPVEINEKLAEYQAGFVEELAGKAPEGVDGEAILAAYQAALDEALTVAEGLLTSESTQPGADMAEAYRGAAESIDYDAAKDAYLELFEATTG